MQVEIKELKEKLATLGANVVEFDANKAYLFVVETNDKSARADAAAMNDLVMYAEKLGINAMGVQVKSGFKIFEFDKAEDTK